MAILLGEIFGGYTGVLLGDRFSFLGALVGIIVFTALLSFVFSALVLWFTRRIVKTEQL